MNKAQLLDFFGSVTEAANAVGVNKSAISQWPNTSELTPTQEAKAIAAALKTRGQVPAEWLKGCEVSASGEVLSSVES